MDQFETRPALKPSNGFEAGWTILKLAGPFWNPQMNTDSFKVVQGLLDLFKTICSDGTNPDHFKSIRPSKPDHLFKPVLARPTLDGILACRIAPMVSSHTKVGHMWTCLTYAVWTT